LVSKRSARSRSR